LWRCLLRIGVGFVRHIRLCTSSLNSNSPTPNRPAKKQRLIESGK
jgi:hypothetical protein